jgi:hypothetical protein
MADDILGFVVNADGSIENGPPGWVGALVGDTYTVTHDQNGVVVPTLTAIGLPNDTTGCVVTSQLVNVGENSFSWKNNMYAAGWTTQCATAVRACPLP